MLFFLNFFNIRKIFLEPLKILKKNRCTERNFKKKLKNSEKKIFKKSKPTNPHMEKRETDSESLLTERRLHIRWVNYKKISETMEKLEKEYVGTAFIAEEILRNEVCADEVKTILEKVQSKQILKKKLIQKLELIRNSRVHSYKQRIKKENPKNTKLWKCKKYHGEKTISTFDEESQRKILLDKEQKESLTSAYENTWDPFIVFGIEEQKQTQWKLKGKNWVCEGEINNNNTTANANNANILSIPCSKIYSLYKNKL